MLLSLHFAAAGFLATPELMLADSESQSLADAVSKVTAFYNQKLDPKMLAWFNLALVAGGIYGSRIVAVRARLKVEAGGKPIVVAPRTGGGSPAPVVQMPGKGAQTPADLFGLDYSATQAASTDGG